MAMKGSVVVLGGGVSGMAVSRHLAMKGFAVTCAEQNERFGGWVLGSRNPSTQVFFEKGPHSMRPRHRGNGLRIVQLIQELGLEKEALCSQGTERFVWANNKLIRLPSNLKEVFTNPLTWKLPPRVVLEALIPPGLFQADKDMTIGDFVGKKLGKDAKLLVSAMVAGIFAGDVDRLSVKSCFPDLVRYNQAGLGSLVRGLLLPPKPSSNIGPPKDQLSPLVKATGITFREGMGRFAQKLQLECERVGVSMSSNSCINHMQRDISGKWTISTFNGHTYQSDIVVSTLSPESLSQLLQPAIPELETLISKIGKVDVAVVNLAYSGHQVHLPPRGFGHLVAEKHIQEATGCLGVIYDSNAFPDQQPDDVVVVSVMMGGANAPWISQRSETELVERAQKAMLDQLNIGLKPLEQSVVLHRNCIPQYGIGHSVAAQSARERLKKENLILFGTGVLGAGIADSVGGALSELEASSWAQ